MKKSIIRIIVVIVSFFTYSCAIIPTAYDRSNHEQKMYQTLYNNGYEICGISVKNPNETNYLFKDTNDNTIDIVTRDIKETTGYYTGELIEVNVVSCYVSKVGEYRLCDSVIVAFKKPAQITETPKLIARVNLNDSIDILKWDNNTYALFNTKKQDYERYNNGQAFMNKGQLYFILEIKYSITEQII